MPLDLLTRATNGLTYLKTIDISGVTSSPGQALDALVPLVVYASGLLQEKKDTLGIEIAGLTTQRNAADTERNAAIAKAATAKTAIDTALATMEGGTK